jgi:ABC-2 type transport system ATP-binding protein
VSTVLELAGVEQAFVGVRVLKGIDLTVAASEVVGLVGPNGAGKTTTLGIAATLLRPTSGRVLVLGHDAVHDPASARPLLGLMPDQFGVYDDMRSGEYLRFFGNCYRVQTDRLERRVTTALAEAGIEPSRPVGELSKGLRQRLFFVRTLLHDPPLVLLDEPFSGMDPAAVAWTTETVQREAAGGRAFLVASHDLPELERVCTRIVALKGGRIVLPSPAGTTTYLLGIGGDQAAARRLLAARFPDADLRVRAADTLELTLRGNQDGNELLRVLLEAGVAVTAFERRAVAVDELFGRVGASRP